MQKVCPSVIACFTANNAVRHYILVITRRVMKVNIRFWFLVCLLGIAWSHNGRSWAQSAETETKTLVVMPGDTWVALAWRFGVDAEQLLALNGRINRMQEPAIGSVIRVPAREARPGALVRTLGMGWWQTAVSQGLPLWTIALTNGMRHPFMPALYQPLFLPGGTMPPRDLPIGFRQLTVSHAPAHPGEAVAIRGERENEAAVQMWLGSQAMTVGENGRFLVGLAATGAFLGTAAPELAIQPAHAPLWVQPWQFTDKEWTFQQITLTGSAAQIDQESIRQERERLFAIWETKTAVPHWHTPFQLPITNYLEISSYYGARRSYNGGPYATYHEGVDFSAYGGTPVYAPATGQVVVAEFLYVRGGTVIIDHGLGVYSGMYHMSSITVAAGDNITTGQQVGTVGTTGLSTGNHLHWDLLVNGTWVDGLAWLEQDMACWILAGLNEPCR